MTSSHAPQLTDDPLGADEDPANTLDGARDAARRGKLDEWVVTFLSSPGSDNAALADVLAGRGLEWHGPVRLQFDSLHRLVGPPDEPALDRLDEGDLDTVKSMCQSIEDGWEPAPLVVSVSTEHDHLVVEDGNHRIEALRHAGLSDYWSVVGTSDDALLDRLVREASPDT